MLRALVLLGASAAAQEKAQDNRARLETMVHSSGTTAGFTDGEKFTAALMSYRTVVLASCCAEAGCEGINEGSCPSIGAEVRARPLVHYSHPLMLRGRAIPTPVVACALAARSCRRDHARCPR